LFAVVSVANLDLVSAAPSGLREAFRDRNELEYLREIQCEVGEEGVLTAKVEKTGFKSR
jgi:hypothetical protein